MKMQRYFGPVLVLALLGISGAVFVSTPFTAIAQDDIQSVAASSVVRQLGTTEPDFGNTTTGVAEIPEKSAGAQEWQGDYFFFDAEEGTIGEEIPHHQNEGPNFCGPECGSPTSGRATYQSTGGAPQGNQYFHWHYVPDVVGGDVYCQIQDKTNFPLNLTLGKTYYLAYYMNFTRIDGNDIWHECSSCQSADKGVELHGSGIRWITARGQWDHMAANQDHHFTVWVGNPTYHLNPELEPFEPNIEGYDENNPIQLKYETWYSIVLGVKIATNDTGTIAMWLNGTKILEYDNITTSDNEFPVIERIGMGGTVAQPAYDAPSHYRKFDALILTDSWQDIIDGGYLSDPETDETLLLSGASSDQSIHLTWTITGTLPVTSTWQITYDGPTGNQTSPISGIISPTRAYTLTGLTNYTWYTVTLNAMLDNTAFLTDTVKVMPTDIFVYLPLVLRGYGP